MSTYLCAALASRSCSNSTSARGLGIASWGTDLGHFERKREFVRSRSSMNSTRSVFLDFERVSCNRSGVLLFSSVTAASAETHSRDNSNTEDTPHAISTLTLLLLEQHRAMFSLLLLRNILKVYSFGLFLFFIIRHRKLTGRVRVEKTVPAYETIGINLLMKIVAELMYEHGHDFLQILHRPYQTKN